MEVADKIKVFDKELESIKNDDIRAAASYLVGNIPDYIFEAPASSTGKYHPSYALGEGGLIRHTKAAVGIARDILYRTEMYDEVFDDDTKDYIIVALMLHDCMKSGNPQEKYTRADHPLLAANFVQEYMEIYCKENNICDASVVRNLANQVCPMIKSHMGQWNTDFRWHKEILPKPVTAAEKFVHLCDYLASRKYLEYVFENN